MTKSPQIACHLIPLTYGKDGQPTKDNYVPSSKGPPDLFLFPGAVILLEQKLIKLWCKAAAVLVEK